METLDLIREINSLPLDKKFLIVEQTLKFIKKEELGHQLARAADALYEDYTNDAELTAFTKLDFEGFYEAK
jgi:hypothetical protein